MNIYDKANELAGALSESEEYKALLSARDKVAGDTQAKEMLLNFKKSQFELQKLQMMGQEIREEQINQLQSLYQVVTLNPALADYLNAELKFGQIFSDVYSIIGKAVEIDLDIK